MRLSSSSAPRAWGSPCCQSSIPASLSCARNRTTTPSRSGTGPSGSCASPPPRGRTCPGPGKSFSPWCGSGAEGTRGCSPFLPGIILQQLQGPNLSLAPVPDFPLCYSLTILPQTFPQLHYCAVFSICFHSSGVYFVMVNPVYP